MTSSESQHVQGRYNIEDVDGVYAHIVGNGYWDENTYNEIRSNAHTLDWEGNAWFAGDVTTGSGKSLDDTAASINDIKTNAAYINTTEDESEEDPTHTPISVIDPAGAEESDIGSAADAYKTKVAMSNTDARIKELEDENAELKAQITELNSKMPINGQQHVDFIISSQPYSGGVVYLSNSVYLPTGYSMSLVSVIACGASGDFVPDLQLQHFGNYWRVITLNTNLAGCMMQCEILVSKDD